MKRAALLLLTACMGADVDAALDECRAIVETETDRVRAEVWEACSEAYADVQAELQALHKAGCDPYLNGYLTDWLHAQGCWWEGSNPAAARWTCAGAAICEVP